MNPEPTNLHPLTSEPTADEFPSFLSYASADRVLAEAVLARLKAAGFRVWFDRERLKGGYDWRQHLLHYSEEARAVLVVLTPRWKDSWWTRFEAYGAEKVFLLHCGGDIPECLTPPLARWQITDLREGQEQPGAFDSLAAELRAHLATPPPEKAARIAHVKLTFVDTVNNIKIS